MSDPQLFKLLSAVPLVGWAALLMAPWGRDLMVAVARVVAVALAVGYAAMLAAALSRPGAAAPDFNSLAFLAHAFSDPHVMLIGWTHYLAFDLWVGAWEVEEAGRSGVRHWAVVPSLVLTFLAGPVGLLLFLGMRAVARARSGRAAAERGGTGPARRS